MPIAKIQLPDGRIGRFEVPEGTTPEEVMSFANQQFGASQPTSQKPREETFSDQMRERGSRFADIAQGQGGYGESLPESALQTAGNVVGTGADMIGAAIKPVARLGYSALPEFAQEGIQDVGEFAAPYAQKYDENLEVFNRSNPRAGANLEAVREMGNIVPLANPAVRKGAGAILDKAADVGGEAVKNVAVDSLKAVKKFPGEVVENASNFKTGLSARKGDDLIDEAGEFKSEAGSIRSDVKNQGVVIKPDASRRISETLQNKLNELEFIPELSPKTSIIVNKIKDSSERGLTLNQLDQYRRMLRKARDEDTVAASEVRRAIDDAVNALEPGDLAKGDTGAINQLNAFRQQYTQASKFEDIAEIVKKSGNNTDNLKNGLNRFMNNKNNTKGWSDEELRLLKNAANSGTMDNIMKGLGRFGYDSSNPVMPVVGGSLAASVSGTPAAATLVGAGTVSRGLRKVLTKGKTEKLLREIEKDRKPVGRVYNGEILPPEPKGTDIVPSKPKMKPVKKLPEN